MSRIGYYLSSIPTILTQIENWPEISGILLHKQPVVKIRNGCKFKVRSFMDVWVVKETCLDRDYESSGTKIQDGSTIIDIGAAFGDFSILAAFEHPSSQVYAIEPFPESYTLLEENIKINSLRNIKTFPIAVGAQSGEMTLFTTGEAVQHTTTNIQISDQAISLKVQGLCLDDFFQKNDIAVCDVLKIDCEGAEFDILFKTGDVTLKKIKGICLEYHDGFTKFSHIDLMNFLQQKGFQVKTTPNPVYSYLGFLYAFQESPI